MADHMALLTRLKITGTVTQLLLRASREAGFEKAATGEINLTFAGPENDCHTGLTRKADSRTLPLYKRNTDIRNVRQVTILSEEELTDIATALEVPEIKPEWFGANMVISGIPDLTLLPPSTRLQFPSNATLVVDMENLPCSQIAEVVGRHYPDVQFKLVKAATHKRGVTTWVEREGNVKTGDTVGIVIPPQRLYPHAS
jgi:hypothetical protein